MEREQIEEIIEKYQRKSSQEHRYGADKCIGEEKGCRLSFAETHHIE